MTSDFLKEKRKGVESALDSLLPAPTLSPQILHRAMRYSIFNGGKRIRPILCLLANSVCGGEEKNALTASVALECIHVYSLIHDDLPCMDDDDMRREKLSCHKKFGEDIALLAGVSLLTKGFEILSQMKETSRYKTKDYISEIAKFSGSLFLIKGQCLDILNEKKKCSLKMIQDIHSCKTGALITASVKIGAMSANATPRRLKALTEFGEKIGLAFQITDDVLDLAQNSKTLGKTAGKDIKNQKSTYPALIGMVKSKKEIQSLTQEAISALSLFGKAASPLREIAQKLVSRAS